MKKAFRYGCLAVLLVLSPSLAQVPQLGSASDKVWSRSQELSIGRAAYERLLHNGDIFESASDVDYLSYLGGNKIASYADTRLGLRFYLAAQEKPITNCF